MSITPPEDYLYFTVKGRFLRTVVDTGDPDRYPDVIPATGTFKFKPRAPWYKNLNMPATFVTNEQTGTLDGAGYLVDHRGEEGVILMSSNSPGVSPSGWTWNVTMEVNGQQLPSFDLPADIAPGSEVDLTTVMPAASASAGVVVIVTESSRLAAEAARDEALEAVDAVLGGVEAAVEAYLLANPPGGSVDSVNGQTGVVIVGIDDISGLTAALSGKADTGHTHSNYVPTTRTVAGKALSSNVTLAASDVGAVPTTRTVAGKALSADVTLAASDVGAVPTTRTVAGKALSADVTLAKADVGLANVDNTSDAAKPVSTATQTALDGKVPTTRTVAGKALSSNVTLVATDVGALPVALTEPVVKATAADTWPTLTSLGLTGFTGTIIWDHTAYGVPSEEPPEIRAGDRGRWLPE